MCNLITKILKSLVICYHTLMLIFQDIELGGYLGNNKKKTLLTFPYINCRRTSI